MATKKKKKTPKKNKLVPMKAVKCPICEGKGRVDSPVINAPVKCRGCDGKGWVEVHYAEVVKAPKVMPQPNPADWIPQSDPQPAQPIPWKTYPIDGTQIIWGDTTVDYTANSTSADYTVTYTGDEWVSSDKALFNQSGGNT